MWDAGNDLELMIGSNEQVLWRGKPDKKCFILESIFNPLLPFALIWALVDLGVLGVSVWQARNDGDNILMFVVPFLLLHMMPVWIYIGGVFFSFKKYKNTSYIITNKGIYISGGMFSFTTEMKPFTDLSHINIHRGIIDQWLGVGDVVTVCSHDSMGSISSSSGHSGHSHSHGMQLVDLADYQKVFQLIKDLQTDIYSDTMYPNDLRPAQNHGYQTEYVGRSASAAEQFPSFNNDSEF